MRSQRLVPLAGVLAMALVLTACSGDDGGDGAAAEPQTGGDADPSVDLSGVCPDSVVIQTDWYPESEYAAVYQLVGDGYEIDTDAKSVSGPLVAQGEETGVSVEVRSGGPAIGFEQVPAQMYADESITLGQINTDGAVQFSLDQPVTAVVAPVDISPWIIMWSAEEHPEWNTIVDIGQTDTTVLYFEGNTYMDYLIGSGQLRESQIDGSFDGTPTRFIAEGGQIAVQNFATDAPYSWVEEVEEWGRPLDFQLIHDTGYPLYSQALGVRSGEKEELAPCLERLVPIIQQAQVDFMADPVRTNELIVELVEEYRDFWVYTPEHAEFTWNQLRELGLVDNGHDDTLGNFDPERVQEIIDIVTPIFEGQNVPIAEDLQIEDIATNEFIDDSISLPTS